MEVVCREVCIEAELNLADDGGDDRADLKIGELKQSYIMARIQYSKDLPVHRCNDAYQHQTAGRAIPYPC